MTAADAAAAYDAVVDAGFAPAAARDALRALTAARLAVMPDAALDWLCLHAPADALPARFRGAARARAAAAGPVRVVAAKPRGGPRDMPSSSSESESSVDSAAARDAERAAALSAAAASAAEAAASKAYTLRYLQEATSSSSDDDGEGGGAPETAAAAAAAVADSKFESWADPAAAAARAAARKRVAMPPAERAAVVVAEWGVARAEAARAKAGGDRARQGLVGRLMASLKREAGELRLTDAQLEGDECEGERSDAPSGSASDDNGAGMALFAGDGDGDAPGLAWDAPTVKAPTVDELLAPWGAAAAAALRKKGAPKAAAPPRAEPKPPKALLQALCAKRGAPPPRFRKLPPGGDRGGTTRYACAVDPPPLPRGATKPVAPPRATEHAMPVSDDGWDTVQDAQNGASLRALLRLTGGGRSADGADVLRSLGEPWASLWVSWVASGPGDDAGDVGGGDAGRDEFLAGLAAAEGEGGARAPAPAAAPEPERAPDATLRLPTINTASVAAESASLAAANAAFAASPDGARWLAARAALPVAAIQADLLAALDAHDVVVVGGDTGCGKTTQVPQFLLDAAIEKGTGGGTRILITQPRRIAAVSVADRVAAERGQPPPGAPGGVVGHHVRLDPAHTRATRLLFCTTGILLRRLAGDPALGDVSHVILDEVHERGLQSDFALALLRRLVPARRAAGRPLKLVLMSATLDASLFANYFGGAPSLAAAGRTHPVEIKFLEDAHAAVGYRLAPDSRACLRETGKSFDRKRLEKAAGGRAAAVAAGWGDDARDGPPLNRFFDAADFAAHPPFVAANMARLDEMVVDLDLIEELVAHIDAEAGADDDGAVLVFLPGFADIASLADRLSALPPACRDGRWRIVCLHSSVSGADQRQAFVRPPAGVRKIVLATNIAETSLTIDDVVYVIDAAKVKERRHDAGRGMSLLCEDFVSRAGARQRAGRAGRVRPGVCYTLVTKRRHNTRLRAFQAPEMVRVPLEELVLQIHALGVGPAAAFLAGCVEPPPAKGTMWDGSWLVMCGAGRRRRRLSSIFPSNRWRGRRARRRRRAHRRRDPHPPRPPPGLPPPGLSPRQAPRCGRPARRARARAHDRGDPVRKVAL